MTAVDDLLCDETTFQRARGRLEFETLARALGKERDIKAGSYEITEALRPTDLLDKLTRGEWRPEAFDGAVFRLDDFPAFRSLSILHNLFIECRSLVSQVFFKPSLVVAFDKNTSTYWPLPQAS